MAKKECAYLDKIMLFLSLSCFGSSELSTTPIKRHSAVVMNSGYIFVPGLEEESERGEPLKTDDYGSSAE